jgi:hypothetical protein
VQTPYTPYTPYTTRASLSSVYAHARWCAHARTRTHASLFPSLRLTLVCPSKKMWYVMDVALRDEETQKKGVLIINNMAGASRDSMNRNAIQGVLHSLQNLIPVRLGGIRLFNQPVSLGPPSGGLEV